MSCCLYTCSVSNHNFDHTAFIKANVCRGDKAQCAADILSNVMISQYEKQIEVQKKWKEIKENANFVNF